MFNSLVLKIQSEGNQNVALSDNVREQRQVLGLV